MSELADDKMGFHFMVLKMVGFECGYKNENPNNASNTCGYLSQGRPDSSVGKMVCLMTTYIPLPHGFQATLVVG